MYALTIALILSLGRNNKLSRLFWVVGRNLLLGGVFGSLLLPSAALAASDLAANASDSRVAGVAVHVSGGVFTNGEPLLEGGDVLVGQLLTTDSEGSVYISLVDNGFLALRKDSSAKVVEYQTEGEVKVRLDLIKGAARSITGQSVENDKQRFRFNTPVAAIGVRGTDFTVFANADFTSVDIASGEVLVSAYSQDCVREAFGACSVGTSLKPDDSGYLFIGREMVKPILRDDPSFQPDFLSPPQQEVERLSAASEDNKTGEVPNLVGSVEGPATQFDSSLGYVNDVDLSMQEASDPGSNGETQPQEKSPDLTGSYKNFDASSNVLFGQYQTLGGKIADQEVLKIILNSNYTDKYFTGLYLVARNNSYQPAVPQSDKIGFRLLDSESIMYNRATGQQSFADVSNATLTIDFGKKEFTSGLSVSSELGRLDLEAQGVLRVNGRLEERADTSSMTFRGFISEDVPSMEAIVGFESNDSSSDLGASGLTQWRSQ